jgi:hypothetical protein
MDILLYIEPKIEILRVPQMPDGVDALVRCQFFRRLSMTLQTFDEKMAALAARLGPYVAVLDAEDIKAIIEEEYLLPPANASFMDVLPLLPATASSYEWN